jgi:phosphoribosylanthranilate isomerase
MRTRVKICGITRVEDALAAAAAGADAIGFVFDPKSPRYLDPRRAASVARALPPYITVVGLFVDAAPETVHEALRHASLDLLQFHGNEPPDYCRAFPKPYVKAIHMTSDVHLPAEAQRFSDAAGLVLDTYSAAAAGGTGETFDWSRIPSGLAKPVILAGGLTPANVAEAVRRVHPYAVDVSSGVEAAKGIKDAKKISAFIEAVRVAA